MNASAKRSGRDRLHPAKPHQAEEELAVEPVLAGLAREVLLEQRDLLLGDAGVSGTNRFGAPRSPSTFGISYSRIRWLRKVFQVSSQASR